MNFLRSLHSGGKAAGTQVVCGVIRGSTELWHPVGQVFPLALGVQVWFSVEDNI